MAKPSKTQLDVIDRLKQTGSHLIRLGGGFWTFDGVALDARGVPVWWVTVQTVRAMEKAGWLQRNHYYAEEWRDYRSLTDAGMKL